jgi:hypothetical protein
MSEGMWVTAFQILLGAAIAFATTQLNSSISWRRAKKDAEVVYKREQDASQKAASQTEAKASLDDLDVIISSIDGQSPGVGEGFSYTFDASHIRALRNKVARIPDERVRRAVEKALDLLGGWNVLADHGTTLDRVPMDQQKNALRDARRVLEACVRGEDPDSRAVERISRKHQELGAANKAEEEAMRSSKI